MALRRIIIAHFDCFFFHADVIVMAAKAGPEDFFGIESEYPVDGQPQFVTAFGTIRYDPPAPEAPKWVRKGKPAAPAAPKWEKKEKSQIFSRPQKKREAEEFGENFADFIGERFDAEIPAEIPAGGLVEDQKKFIDSFLREGEIPDPSAPKNAAELAEKIREKSEREELQEIAERDKDGSLQNLRKIWNNIPQFFRMTTDEILEYLKQQIIFDDGDLLALNKPPGLPMHGGPKVSVSLGRMFPRLASTLKCERLYLLHRLDQRTTGVVLLCRRQETMREIRQMFFDRRVVKKYWCLTKGVPTPDEGIIDIPLSYQRVGGRFKMVPCPGKNSANENLGKKIDSTSKILAAKTEFKILETQTKCAFVECTLHTGFKHQIRAHLGFGMDTPIIGDHKYSDYLRYVPQRLPGEILNRLGIRSQKSRDVPFCLHAREIQLPEYRNNQNLFIRAPLPKHMIYIMKRLKFAIPK